MSLFRSSNLCILLLVLNLDAIFASKNSAIVCNSKEFLCTSNSRCIPEAKVCNFIKDCSNGEDEAECGTCNFENWSQTSCGLKFVSDRLFDWFLNTFIADSEAKPLVEPRYRTRLKLNRTREYMILEHRNDASTIYVPKLLFSELKPTNNGKCSFEFKIYLTTKPDGYSGIKEAATVPNILLASIEANIPDNVTIVKRQSIHQNLLNLDLKKRLENKEPGIWLEYKLMLGTRQTIWTQEMEVDLNIEGSLISLADLKFKDCKPISNEGGRKGIPVAELKRAANPSDFNCDANQFRCERSGLCIDSSLRCDFGLDCGDIADTSDEEGCEEYPGRCNFESRSKCNWLTGPASNSWLWLSSHMDDQQFYGQLARPPVDHTFLNEFIGGHYIMTNMSSLSQAISSSFELEGPEVLLKKGYNKCNFRFWAYVPPASGLNLDIVSHELISGQDLSNSAKGGINGGWKRFDVKLIDLRHEKYLKLLLTNTELEEKSFLALDDFSFTPGCNLKFKPSNRQETLRAATKNVCGKDQFYCQVPTAITHTQCIPKDNYCDFKDDCGDSGVSRAKSSGLIQYSLSSDEQKCPHRCEFDKNEIDCNFKVIDGKELKKSGQFAQDTQINELFTYDVFKSTTKNRPPTISYFQYDGNMKITSDFSSFEERNSRRQQQVAIDGDRTKYHELKSLRVQLPKFSKSHANCKFDLTYAWSKESQNLRASIIIDPDGGSELLLKKIALGETVKKQNLLVGLGNRKKSFSLQLRVEFEGTDLDMMKSKLGGSFYIYSYHFYQCSYFPGLIQPSEDAILADELLPSSQESKMNLANLTCDPGFFQCIQPVVCLPVDLMCDMQLDCESGLDESEENCKNHLKFNFEHIDKLSDELFWHSADEESTGWEWYIASSATSYHHRSIGSGPPFDHTNSGGLGNYIRMRTKRHFNQHKHSHEAYLESSVFKPTDGDCKMTGYIYFYGKDIGELQILMKTLSFDQDGYKINNEPEYILFETQQLNQNDYWQKIYLILDSGGMEFSIVLKGFADDGKSGLIALDDVSFSPECQLSERETNVGSVLRAFAWLVVIVASSVVTIIVLLMLIKRQKRRGNLCVPKLSALMAPHRSYVSKKKIEKGSSSGRNSDGNLEYSMENLGRNVVISLAQSGSEEGDDVAVEHQYDYEQLSETSTSTSTSSSDIILY